MQNYEAFCKSGEVCTLAVFFRILADSPLLVAANRDEHYDRPSDSPRDLDTVPKVIAGRDLRAGGTWLGVNEHGVLAAMLNRRSNTPNAAVANGRSRGLLCMDLLARRSAAEAASWLRDHQAEYNPFTALVADRKQAHVTYNAGANLVTEPLTPGLHVFSSAADFDLRSSKADRAYELFGALAPQLKKNDGAKREAVGALHRVLADHSLPSGSADPGDAICVHRGISGTVSASIAVLYPSPSRFEIFHCPGAPCQKNFGAALELNLR